jgi:putative MFS transporter
MSLTARLDRLALSRPHYKLLLIGGLGYSFDGMDGAVVAFLLPRIQELWGLSTASLGLVGSAAPFGFFFGAILAGWMGDRFGRKKVMLWALGLLLPHVDGGGHGPQLRNLPDCTDLCRIGCRR